MSKLIQYDLDSLTVTARESKHREFKQALVPNHLSDYTKTIAAFGNADGGYILFGIGDKPRQIVGAPEIPDEAQSADLLRDDFDPEVSIMTKTYAVGALQVYAVGTEAGRRGQSSANEVEASECLVVTVSHVMWKLYVRGRFIIDIAVRHDLSGTPS